MIEFTVLVGPGRRELRKASTVICIHPGKPRSMSAIAWYAQRP